MKHVSASADDSLTSPFPESPEIIMDLKEENMDFLDDSSKKNSTKIINKVDISSYI